MRSQLMTLTLIATALAGCGKDVQKNAQLNGQMSGLNGMSGNGSCVDPLESLPYQPILRADELNFSGNYTLLSFQAVGLASLQQQNASHATGISVLSGGGNGSDLELSRVCSDFTRIPQSEFQWGISAPSSILGPTGSISQEIAITQSIRASQIVGENLSPSRARECLNTSSMIQANPGNQPGNCSGAQFFRVDQNTIGVLRTVDTSDGRGMVIRSKIFAQYSNGSAQSLAQPIVQNETFERSPRPQTERKKAARKHVFVPKDVSGPAPRKAKVITTSVVPTSISSGYSHTHGHACCTTGARVVTTSEAPRVIIVKEVPPTQVVLISSAVDLGQGDVKIVAKNKEKEKTKIITEDATYLSKEKSKSKLKIKINRD